MWKLLLTLITGLILIPGAAADPVTFKWIAPTAYDNGMPMPQSRIQHYRLRWKPHGGSSWNPVADIPPDRTEWVIDIPREVVECTHLGTVVPPAPIEAVISWSIRVFALTPPSDEMSEGAEATEADEMTVEKSPWAIEAINMHECQVVSGPMLPNAPTAISNATAS